MGGHDTVRQPLFEFSVCDAMGQVRQIGPLRAYFTSSLTNRPVSAGTREVLLASLSDANWASKSESCYWSQVWEAPERFPDRLALVRRNLTPQEIEAKVAEGLLPTGVF